MTSRKATRRTSSKRKIPKTRAALGWDGARVARTAGILSIVIAFSYVFLSYFQQKATLDPQTILVAALIAVPGVLAVLANASREPRQRLPLLGAASGMLMSLAILSIATIGFALLLAGFLAIVATVRAMAHVNRRAVGIAIVAGVAGAAIPFAFVLSG